mgnify:CR=1 FL=1
MSSKFLPLQDANGDGLNDVCKDEFVVVEEKVCVNCTLLGLVKFNS